MTRTQYCREHIDKVAEECGLEPETVTEIKKIAAFCVDNPAFADLPSRAIRPLIRIKDDDVRANAISSASNALKIGKHPITGKQLEKNRLTEKDVKDLIIRTEKDLRKEIMEEIKEKKPARDLSVIPKKGEFAGGVEPARPHSDQLSEAERHPITAECMEAGCKKVISVRAGLTICDITGQRPENMNGKYPEGCFRYVKEPEPETVTETPETPPICTYFVGGICRAAPAFREHCDPETRKDRGCSVVEDPKGGVLPLHLRNVPAQVQKGSAGVLKKSVPSSGSTAGYVPVEVMLLLKPNDVKTLQAVMDLGKAKEYASATVWCIGCGREELERLETRGGDEE